MNNSVHLGLNIIWFRDLKEPQEPYEVQQNKCNLQPLEQEKPQASTQAGNQQLESSFAEKDGGALLDKLTETQQCTPASKKASSLLGCIGMHVQGRNSSCQFGTCETVSRAPCLVWAPQYKKDMDVLALETRGIL